MTGKKSYTAHVSCFYFSLYIDISFRVVFLSLCSKIVLLEHILILMREIFTFFYIILK